MMEDRNLDKKQESLPKMYGFKADIALEIKRNAIQWAIWCHRQHITRLLRAVLADDGAASARLSASSIIGGN